MSVGHLQPTRTDRPSVARYRTPNRRQVLVAAASIAASLSRYVLRSDSTCGSYRPSSSTLPIKCWLKFGEPKSMLPFWFSTGSTSGLRQHAPADADPRRKRFRERAGANDRVAVFVKGTQAGHVVGRSIAARDRRCPRECKSFGRLTSGERSRQWLRRRSADSVTLRRIVEIAGDVNRLHARQLAARLPVARSASSSDSGTMPCSSLATPTDRAPKLASIPRNTK